MTTAEIPADRLHQEQAPTTAKTKSPWALRWAAIESILDRLGDQLAELESRLVEPRPIQARAK